MTCFNLETMPHQVKMPYINCMKNSMKFISFVDFPKFLSHNYSLGNSNGSPSYIIIALVHLPEASHNIFQSLKSLASFIIPIECIIFEKASERSCNFTIVLDKVPIVIGEAKKSMQTLKGFRTRPMFLSSNLYVIFCYILTVNPKFINL